MEGSGASWDKGRNKAGCLPASGMCPGETMPLGTCHFLVLLLDPALFSSLSILSLFLSEASFFGASGEQRLQLLTSLGDYSSELETESTLSLSQFQNLSRKDRLVQPPRSPSLSHGQGWSCCMNICVLAQQNTEELWVTATEAQPQRMLAGQAFTLKCRTGPHRYPQRLVHVCLPGKGTVPGACAEAA